MPEYYVTSTELEILREHGAEMASYIGEGAALIELGIGSPEKARRLLDHLPDLGWYVPVDISESALDRATRELRAAYHGLHPPPRPCRARRRVQAGAVLPRFHDRQPGPGSGQRVPGPVAAHPPAAR
ncbi:MAG: L-histidine N(alpha)-methyltransferase [Deltaproteobacteria bacterium]|nr:L-histidine N(alpha)-methyltransferase [Deltaproteobacteria bacterium]